MVDKVASRVADMTVEQLRTLISDVVRELILEVTDSNFDPDAGLELQPEIVQRLNVAQNNQEHGKSLDDIERELGLDG